MKWSPTARHPCWTTATTKTAWQDVSQVFSCSKCFILHYVMTGRVHQTDMKNVLILKILFILLHFMKSDESDGKRILKTMVYPGFPSSREKDQANSKTGMAKWWTPQQPSSARFVATNNSSLGTCKFSYEKTPQFTYVWHHWCYLISCEIFEVMATG